MIYKVSVSCIYCYYGHHDATIYSLTAINNTDEALYAYATMCIYICVPILLPKFCSVNNLAMNKSVVIMT